MTSDRIVEVVFYASTIFEIENDVLSRSLLGYLSVLRFPECRKFFRQSSSHTENFDVEIGPFQSKIKDCRNLNKSPQITVTTIKNNKFF